MPSILLFGATGATGREVLSKALIDGMNVSSAARRTIPINYLPASFPGILTQIKVDFEGLVSEKFHDAEMRKIRAISARAVAILLGTTKNAAGSAERFITVDKKYVIEAAKAAKIEDGKGQRLLYCSSAGSSSSSWFLYPKTKGETEEELAALGYEETIIFRPAALRVDKGREQGRWAEIILNPIASKIATLTDTVQIDVVVLAAAFVKASQIGAQGLEDMKCGKWEVLKGNKVWVLNNAEALRLGGMA